MNQLTQAMSSDPQQFIQPKRKRGRPRKDPSLKRIAIAPIPPSFGIKQHKSHQATGSNDATDNNNIIGQAVTGVIDAAFDGGYIVTIRIGNSNTSFKGVVFKTESCIPVTARNDVAPQVQMIKRKDFYGGKSESNGTLLLNQGSSRFPFPPQSTAMVTTKVRSVSVGRGTLVPVVLKPIGALNQASSVNHTLPEASDSRNIDAVVIDEPLTMVLPESPPPPSSSPPGQFKTAKNEQLPLTATMQIAKEACHSSNFVTEGSKQANVIQGNYSNMTPPGFNLQSPYTPMSLKNYGTGRMSELLQAVQENVKNPFVVAGGVESHELNNPNLNPNVNG